MSTAIRHVARLLLRHAHSRLARGVTHLEQNALRLIERIPVGSSAIAARRAATLPRAHELAPRRGHRGRQHRAGAQDGRLCESAGSELDRRILGRRRSRRRRHPRYLDPRHRGRATPARRRPGTRRGRRDGPIVRDDRARSRARPRTSPGSSVSLASDQRLSTTIAPVHRRITIRVSRRRATSLESASLRRWMFTCPSSCCRSTGRPPSWWWSGSR